MSLRHLAVVVAIGIVFSLPARADVGSSFPVYQSDHKLRHTVRSPKISNYATVTVGAGQVSGGRPAGCPPRAWCGCYAANYFGFTGAKARSLWLARNWAREGSPAAGPAPGIVAVFSRGRGGHVGVITAVSGPGKIVLLSGNDGGRVRERERSTKGIIAYRQLR